MDRTKVLYGPRTQTCGETNYLDEKTEFWTELRYCMILGLKPMGKPITWMRKLGTKQDLATMHDVENGAYIFVERGLEMSLKALRVQVNQGFET